MHHRLHQLAMSALVSETLAPHWATKLVESVRSVIHALGICIGLCRLARTFASVSIHLFLVQDPHA